MTQRLHSQRRILVSLLLCGVCGGACGGKPVAESKAAELPSPAWPEKADPSDARIPSPDKLTIPAAAFGKRGSLLFWLTPLEEIRGESKKTMLFAGPGGFNIQLQESPNCTRITLRFGTELASLKRTRVQGLLTRFHRDKAYQIVFTWDSDSPETGHRWYLSGRSQGSPPPYPKRGAIRAAAKDIRLVRRGADIALVTTPILYTHPLTEQEVAAIFAASGRAPCTNEGLFVSSERLTSDMIRNKKLFYATSFDDPKVLKDWTLESQPVSSARVEDGVLVLQNRKQAPGEGERATEHLVFWLKKELPANFLAEWTFCPERRHRGLVIVFFSARGLGGESIFDPKLQKRDGTFKQYHSGDINNYHISYWAGGRGAANLRKNYGFHLNAIGPEYVTPGKEGSFQTVTLLKRGAKIRLAVDGKVSIAYDDNGAEMPVHEHSGWFGLRQMGHTVSGRYQYVRIWALPDK